MINKPAIAEGVDFINFAWRDLGLRVTAERFSDKGVAELQFFSSNGEGEVLLHHAEVNLLATQTINTLAKRLEKNSHDISWLEVLTHVTNETIKIARRSEPVVPIGKKPDTMKIEYQLTPIIEKGQPTTVYAPGGYGKSYIGDYIATLVQLNIVGMNSWTPAPGNVLYLDWEASKEDHDRRVWAIKAGLGIDTEETFLYRFCSQPLVNDIHSIQGLVSEYKIDMVIIDSQMAATGYGPDQAQVASQFYNALRSLRCTTLTFDHVSKEDWKSTSSVGPYGSVVKYNRSRAQFEITAKSQVVGDDYIELALIHRKHNEGKLLNPIGIRINFNQNTEGQLESVTFESCNPADNPEASKTLPLAFQIKDLLRSGAMTIKEIAEELEANEASIRTITNRMEKRGSLVKIGDSWGLKQGI